MIRATVLLLLLAALAVATSAGAQAPPDSNRTVVMTGPDGAPRLALTLRRGAQALSTAEEALGCRAAFAEVADELGRAIADGIAADSLRQRAEAALDSERDACAAIGDVQARVILSVSAERDGWRDAAAQYRRRAEVLEALAVPGAVTLLVSFGLGALLF